MSFISVCLCVCVCVRVGVCVCACVCVCVCNTNKCNHVNARHVSVYGMQTTLALCVHVCVCVHACVHVCACYCLCMHYNCVFATLEHGGAPMVKSKWQHPTDTSRYEQVQHFMDVVQEKEHHVLLCSKNRRQWVEPL